MTKSTPAPDAVRLVPVEPTREMWAAGGTAACQTANQHHDKVVEAVWSAMLAAAPAPATAGGGDALRVAVEALEPFSRMWGEWREDERPSDDRSAWGFNSAVLTWGDFRRATEALAALKSEGK